MRLVLLMAWNEINQLIRIRTVILMLLVLPLLLIFLLGNALDGDTRAVKLSIYSAENDELSLSAKQYLTSAEVSSYLDSRIRDSVDEVQDDLLSGKSDYGFVVVEGEIHLYPGKFTERNMIAESMLNRFIADRNIIQSAQILLPQLTQDQVNSSQKELASSRSLVQIGNLVSGDITDFNKFSALQYNSVAYLVMFMLYSGMTGAIGITKERDTGTLLRLYAMPVSLNTMLLGKLIGVTMFSFIQAAFIILFTKEIYGVNWGTDYGGIALVCVLVSMATVSFAIIISSFIRSRRGIESIFSLLIIVMTFLSGGMIVDLGASIRRIGKFTINHWANEALRRMMAGGSLSESWQAVTILSAITLVLIGLSIVRFRKAVALS
ncbi:ABC transporter permease [Cohnella abietis]|uniref:Transport permease protein n=1 Tax=Cohnella abietis TaxID=2507935 RepID=A0A3T1D962_9BACL|nr:ABC transporter permease [Cohnella abietis]BBI34585.1 transport permease protein [Cohnella abietis]